MTLTNNIVRRFNHDIRIGDVLMSLLPKLRFAHAPGMPGTFSPPLTSKENAS